MAYRVTLRRRKPRTGASDNEGREADFSNPLRKRLFMITTQQVVKCVITNFCLSGFGGLGVIALAFGTQVRGFKPGRSRRI
jgi:hypothetical protein